MKVEITIDKERFNVELKQIGEEELEKIKHEHETLTKSLLSTWGVQKNQIIDFGHVEPSSVQASYEAYRQRRELEAYTTYRLYGMCHPHRDRQPLTAYFVDEVAYFENAEYEVAKQYIERMKEVTCPLEDEERYSIELPQYTMPIPEETSVEG